MSNKPLTKTEWVAFLGDLWEAEQKPEKLVVYDFWCPKCGHTHEKEIVIPEREWVGLEAEEILDLFDISNVYGSKWIEFARTVEAKLKAKNDH
jgi:hypothetical protein